MFKSTEKELLNTNNQTDILSDLLEQLICNSNDNRNIWLSFDYKSLKTAISDYIDNYIYLTTTISPDIPTCEEVVKALGYPSKNAKYWFDFCLNHKYAWASLEVNNGVHAHIYDNEPFNKNIGGYTLDFKTYLLLSFKKPTETDYKEKYERLKTYGHDIDDKECQVDRLISDLFYCKQVPVLDLLKNTLKGE